MSFLDPGLLLNIFFAFLGGLVMNFMPCILPLISLKISSFLNKSPDQKIFLKKNFLYVLGILCFFMGLGFILIFLKFGGKNFIFGSHMQSGLLLFIIFAILILIGFNLAGLFEFQINSLTNQASNILFRFSGFIVEFLNGLLVSFLAVPCTAPFIAGAFTYALGTSYLNIFLISSFMGIGFAFPFILAIIFPEKILKIIPKPGDWMEKFKVLMSFPIFGAAAWILFILIKQGNINFSALCLFFIILSYFFIWFWKNFLHNKKIIKLGIFAIIIFLSYFFFPFQDKIENNLKNNEISYKFGEKQDFSYKKLEELKSKKQKILIAASATWCLTCKVNERSCLSSDEFRKTLEDNKITYLYIDLTNKNEDGEKFLKEHQRVGIPFYLTIDSGGNEKIWNNILTPDLVLQNLREIK